MRKKRYFSKLEKIERYSFKPNIENHQICEQRFYPILYSEVSLRFFNIQNQVVNNIYYTDIEVIGAEKLKPIIKNYKGNQRRYYGKVSVG